MVVGGGQRLFTHISDTGRGTSGMSSGSPVKPTTLRNQCPDDEDERLVCQVQMKSVDTCKHGDTVLQQLSAKYCQVPVQTTLQISFHNNHMSSSVLICLGKSFIQRQKCIYFNYFILHTSKTSLRCFWGQFLTCTRIDKLFCPTFNWPPESPPRLPLVNYNTKIQFYIIGPFPAGNNNIKTRQSKQC